MEDRSQPDVTPALVHELAERLQTLGNYLSAARHGLGAAPRSQASAALDRAANELARASDAFHRLRGQLARNSALPLGRILANARRAPPREKGLQP